MRNILILMMAITLFAIDAREKIGRAKMADPKAFEAVYDAIDEQMKQEIEAVIAGGEDA